MGDTAAERLEAQRPLRDLRVRSEAFRYIVVKGWLTHRQLEEARLGGRIGVRNREENGLYESHD